jgi:hypothetical protein
LLPGRIGNLRVLKLNGDRMPKRAFNPDFLHGAASKDLQRAPHHPTRRLVGRLHHDPGSWAAASDLAENTGALVAISETYKVGERP